MFVTATATYILLLAGGLVHCKGASLACPDWPLCHGMFFPPMRGNIFYEHGHRLIAATVALFTVWTAVWVWRKERASLRPLAVLAILAIVIQIALGAITVIFLLPDMVSTAHLAVGTAFFALLVVLTVRLRPDASAREIEVPGRTRAALFAATGIFFLQMVLGAFVRHADAGLACPDLPFCKGVWLPSLNTLQGVHMLHRYGSLVALAGVIWVFRLSLSHPPLRGHATLALALTGIQIVLGGLSVWTNLAIEPVMAHLAVAILILMSLVILCAQTASQIRARVVAAVVVPEARHAN